MLTYYPWKVFSSVHYSAGADSETQTFSSLFTGVWPEHSQFFLLVVILWNHLLDFVCLPFCDQAHNIWKTSPASVLLAAFPDLDCMFPTIRKKALGSAIVWLAASERWGAVMTARNSLLTCGPWAKDLFYLLPVYLSKLGWPCQEARCHVSVFYRASSTEREQGNYCGHQVEQLRQNQQRALWHWSDSSLEEC